MANCYSDSPDYPSLRIRGLFPTRGDLMKKLWVMGAAAVCLSVLAVSAQANFHRHRGCSSPCYEECAPLCAPAFTVSYVEQKVTAYRTEWKEEKVTINVVRCSYRTEVVPVKQVVMEQVTVPRKVTVLQPFSVA